VGAIIVAMCVRLKSASRAVLASFLLGETLGHLGRLGCALALIGSTIIVLHAPEDKPVETVDEILQYALHPGIPSQHFTHSQSDRLQDSFYIASAPPSLYFS
jgi:hypothetical protein